MTVTRRLFVQVGVQELREKEHRSERERRRSQSSLPGVLR